MMVLWIASLGLALSLLARHHGAEGNPGATPAAWPSAEPRLAPDGLEIMLFVHPRCPCTVRSIDAAASLRHMLEARGVQCGVRTVIRTPAVAGEDDEAWRDSPTVGRLARLGPHRRQFDPGGSIADRWGAITSGHVAIFDASGRRLLDGGLNPARAHAEDPAVLRAIADRLTAGLPVAARPVFGCRIPDAASDTAVPRGSRGPDAQRTDSTPGEGPLPSSLPGQDTTP